MRKLTLYVSKLPWQSGLTIAQLLVRDSQGKERVSEVGDGSNFDPRSRTSIAGICFLIIETYLARKSHLLDGSLPPVHRVNRLHLPFLKTLYNSKSKEIKNWQEDIFGLSPFYEPEQYLERRGSPSSGTAEPYILSGVELDVQPLKKDMTISNEDLTELAESLATGNVRNPERLVTITIIKGKDFEIRSSNRLGALSLNDRIRVQINWNFQSYLYIFWVRCDNEVFSLYPESDLSVGSAELTINDKGERSLLIPKGDEFQIRESPGHETCLVFCSRTSLDKQQANQLKTIVQKSMKNRDGSIELEKTDPREYTISQKKKRLLRRRFGEVEEPKDWESGLIKSVQGLVQKVYPFHIPNRE